MNGEVDPSMVQQWLSEARALVTTLEKNQNAHTRRIEELEREIERMKLEALCRASSR